MRITRVDTTVVAVPDLPLRNVVGCHQPYALRTIVQLHTDDGRTGLGEMPGGTRMRDELQAAAALVVGLDPFALERLRLALRDRPRVHSAFEVPCLDLMGQATGRPVVDLLGGAVRDRVPFSAYLFFKFATPDGWLSTPAGTPGPTGPLGMSDWHDEILTPDAMVREAEAFVDRYGFRALKLKGGVLRPEAELETLRLLRARFGSGYGLRVDPNGGWSVAQAQTLIPPLEDIGLEYYEDPVTGHEAMAEVARRTSLPLATNMCVTGFSDLPALVATRMARVVLADHHWWGGPGGVQRLGGMAEVFGFEVSQHSNTHLGISMAAMVHAAAATPQLVYASDTHYPWQQGWDVVNERFEFDPADGTLPVPPGPGLGVTLNLDALRRFEEIARAVPAEARDDDVMMRRWFPDWRPKEGPAFRRLIT